MVHLNSVRNTTADISKFNGIISEKQSGIISLTKVVVALSILLAILMDISR